MAICVRLIFLISVLFARVSLADNPCQTFQPFPDEARRNPTYELGKSEHSLSDNYITETWYGSLMDFTTTPPGPYKCSTFFPIWAKSAVAARDGTINVTVCTQVPGDECAESTVIKAINCGSYRVYKLIQTAPDSAYCLAPVDKALADIDSSSYIHVSATWMILVFVILFL